MSVVLSMGASQLARLIRTGRLSSLEVVEAHIARIEAVNPMINALTEARFEKALVEAERVDEQLRAHPKRRSWPALFGVPFSVKEYIGVLGMRQTGGILSRRSHRAASDASTVRRLRRAGAIVLGTTNGPEGGLSMETHNLIYGRTSNPWNLAHTAGGSSGGEGALIAAGGTPFGLGADIGGSIRIPAAFCGICGHKPTGGIIPTTGHYPPASGASGAFLTIGPMARRVEDLRVVTQILLGPDGRDRSCTRTIDADMARSALSAVTVYPMTELGGLRLDAHLADAIQHAAIVLNEAGAEIRYRAVEHLDKGFEIWMGALEETATETYETILGQGERIDHLRTLLAVPFGRAEHTLPALVVSAAEKLAGRLPPLLKRYGALASTLQAELEAMLGSTGVMLYPVYPRSAPKHYRALVRPRLTGCTSLFNILEFPATVVPIGTDPLGLPLALQVIGARGQDALTLSVAEHLERRLGGWTLAEPKGR
ncbi:MAG: amidase [Myxococcota bacterium]|nr:amidase [Myxococcota bacterium]